MRRQLMAAGIAGFLCLAATVAQAGPDEKDSGSTTNEQTNASQLDPTPGKFNKASTLIGMDVKNEKGEKLGEIKDIVIDPDSSRVSYVVMSSGGVLGMGQKLLAMPLTAFSRGPDRTYLVLRATKENVSQAQGLGTNWPSIKEPVGAKPFWQKSIPEEAASAQSTNRVEKPTPP